MRKNVIFTLFYIKEPPQGIPKHFLESEPASEDATSYVLEEKIFSEIIVQKREIIKGETE